MSQRTDSFGVQWQLRKCNCSSFRNVVSTRICHERFLLTHILVNKIQMEILKPEVDANTQMQSPEE